MTKGVSVKELVRSRRVLAAILTIVVAASAAATAYATTSAAAKKEGSVTLYTSQNPIFLADTAKDFEAKYGIKLTVNRQIDATLTQQVNAEEGAHKVNGDVVVIASKPIVLGIQKPQNRWAVNAVGPDLYSRAYNRILFGGPGKANIVGEALLGIAWNPSLYAKGLKDLPDALDPALKGKIGVVDP